MIRPVSRKLSRQSIRGRHRRLGVAEAWLLVAALGTYLVALHNLGNPVPANALTHLTEIAENAGRPIGVAARLMRRADQSQQPIVVSESL